MNKLFTKNELKAVSVTLLLIISFTLFNFQIAKRKTRDFQRRADLAHLLEVLENYKTDNGLYPDNLSDLPLDHLPLDPYHARGYAYLYLSTPKYFQIMATLEGDPEYHLQSVVDRNLKCGDKICNFGRTQGKTPLDKSLQEYQNELSADEK